MNKIIKKFEVGNWYQCTKDFFGKGVTFNKNTAYYCAKEGCLQNEYGCHIAIVKDLYDNFKLWTIDDVKDGDVLAIEPIYTYPSPFVAIYKNHGLDFFNSYCFIGFDGNFYKADNGHSIENIHPATKEQRDILMKAMTDAGYTFDFEKKKLKKIEQNISWSEKDERTIKRIDSLLYAINESDFKDIHIWLESLKNMVQSSPKQELNEDDENYINDLIKYFSQNEKLKNTKEDIVIWLKSIKDRYTWKPSNEQLEVFEHFVRCICESGYDNKTKLLRSLLFDLKKLKGE